MAIRPELHLHEEILLLALRDDSGTVPLGSNYGFAVAGAFLAELIVRGRLELTGPEKKRLVQLVDATPVGEELLDEALQKVANARRRASVATWVGRFAVMRDLRDRLARALCQYGILRADERDVFILFKRRTYPAVNPEPERQVMQRLENAIFGDGAVDPRTLVLLSLVDKARMLPTIFDKTALKARKQRIRSLVENEALGRAVKDAIEAAEAAMVVMMP